MSQLDNRFADQMGQGGIMFFGLVVMVVGLVFLLQNLGVINGDAWDIVWPAIIILLGISILFKPFKKTCCENPKVKKEKKS